MRFIPLLSLLTARLAAAGEPAESAALPPRDYGYESVKSSKPSLDALNRTSLVATDRLLRDHIQFHGGTDRPYNENAGGYAALLSRVLLNAAYLPRQGIAEWVVRLKNPGAADAPAAKAGAAPATPHKPTELSPAKRRALWQQATRAYAAARTGETWQKFSQSALGPVLPEKPAYHEVKRFTVTTAEGSYELVSFVWEPLKGLQIPGLLSIPRGASARSRVPAVLNYPACGEGAGRDSASSSPQRRLGQIALAGMVGLYTEGFCGNGLIDNSSDYGMNYSQYLGLLGGKAGEAAFNIAFAGEFIRLAKSFEFVDPDRLAVTGYSFGLAIAKVSFAQFRDVKAAVLVGDLPIATSGKDSRLLAAESNIRSDIRFSYPVHHRYSFDTPDRRLKFERPMTAKESALVERARLQFNARYAPPIVDWALGNDLDRDTLFILAEQDGFNEVTATVDAISALQKLGSEVGAAGRLELERVPGNHNYDLSRSAIAVRWLAARFALPEVAVSAETAAALPFFNEDLLYPTEFRDRLLDRTTGTLQTFYGNLALTRLHNKASRLSNRPVPAGLKPWLRESLNLPALQQPTNRRPLIIDACRFQLEGIMVDFNYILVPLNDQLTVGVALLSHDLDQIDARIAVRISASELLPPPEELWTALRDYGRVATIVLPGFGIAAESHVAEGNLARELYDTSPLDGIGVAAIQSAITTITSDCTGYKLDLLADGIDTSVTATLATLLDDRIHHTRLQHAADSIAQIVSQRPLSYPPTFLYTPNIYTAYDLPELRQLAGTGRIEVLSTARSSDYEIYGPRW